MSSDISHLTLDEIPPNTYSVFKLAWPMALKAIFLHGTVVIDGWLVSSMGEMQLASLGMAAAIAGLPLGAILAFSHALQIKTAQTMGRGIPEAQKSVLFSGLAISFTISLLLVFAIMMLDSPILGLLTAAPDIQRSALNYLSVFFYFIIGEAIGQSLSSYFNGCGRTKIPLYSFCLAVPVNITSSVILIHGYFGLPTLGVTGAALGSVLGVIVQLVYLLVMLYRIDGYLLSLPPIRLMNFGVKTWRQFLFSLPIAATFMSATFSSRVAELMYAKMTLNEFAALTIIAPWIMVAGTISMQWSQATGIIVAQLLGKNASPQILNKFLSGAWRGVFAAASIVAGIYGILCLGSPYIYGNLSEQTTSILIEFLPILLILPFVRSTNAICGNTLRASGDTIYVMNLFLCSQWLFRIPLIGLAIFYFDLSAFWVLFILLVEEFVKFIPFHKRLYTGAWLTARVN